MGSFGFIDCQSCVIFMAAMTQKIGGSMGLPNPHPRPGKKPHPPTPSPFSLRYGEGEQDRVPTIQPTTKVAVCGAQMCEHLCEHLFRLGRDE